MNLIHIRSQERDLSKSKVVDCHNNNPSIINGVISTDSYDSAVDNSFSKENICRDLNKTNLNAELWDYLRVDKKKQST
jgi:hypothetical protein